MKKLTDVKSSPQNLGTIIKSVRKTMRKDKGLNGDLDRIPLITWIMFLKFLDDHERLRETEALLTNEEYKTIIDSPYKWRDWAAKEDGITGSELLAFINQEEAIRPDGTRGKGLFAYLKSLQGANGKDTRDVVSAVFRGVDNRMVSGYLLREVVNKINKIHFDSTEEIHTLAFFYESLLKEMRDSAGDSGEFYTPRPVIKFMTKALNPTLGETVLDPAAGTGGFLVEVFELLKPQCKKSEDLDLLQNNTLYGFEAKPMPFLLCQMNMLLHGIETPQIDPGNALRFPLREIVEKDRVNIVITNPPFGGEEEAGIQGNFPSDKQTSETAFLFLQLIMRKLKDKGRCAIVVPDGVLSSNGVGERIREELVNNFELHSIVRLPEGVFSPYTDIPANLIFFNKSGKTKRDIWYYELPLPENRKKYTKTMPLKFEEFEECLFLWKSKIHTNNSWIVKYEDIANKNFNLDIKNPSKKYIHNEVSPIDIFKQLREKIETIHTYLSGFAKEYSNFANGLENEKFQTMCINSFVKQQKRVVEIDPSQSYTFLGMSNACKGLFKKEEKTGQQIKAEKAYLVKENDFVYSRLFARLGSFAVADKNFEGCYVSNEFPVFEVDTEFVLPRFLLSYFSLPSVWQYVESKCRGTTKASRFRFKEEYFLEMEIPLPNIKIQKRVIEIIEKMNEFNRIQNEVSEMQQELGLSILVSLYKDYLNH
jgi:type I restriction enzyme M protein